MLCSQQSSDRQRGGIIIHCEVLRSRTAFSLTNLNRLQRIETALTVRFKPCYTIKTGDLLKLSEPLVWRKGLYGGSVRSKKPGTSS